MPRKLHLLAILVCFLAGADRVAAHPHMWVEVRAQVTYNQEGELVGIRQEWKFDEVYSTYALQDVQSKQKGVFTRQELEPLAKLNMDDLKDSDFFTHARVDGNNATFSNPVDYWFEYEDKVLTLHFTLPLKQAVQSKKLELEVYDPMYFIGFTLAEKGPVILSGAPPSCTASVAAESDKATEVTPLAGDAFFRQFDSKGFGFQFARTISVQCR